MASYSSEEEDYSGSEEELSEEVRPCMLHDLPPPFRPPCSPWRWRDPHTQMHLVQFHTSFSPLPCAQELAAALAVQRERASRGGGAAPGPAGSDDDEEEDGGEGEGGRSKGAPLREAIYNVDALHDKLEDIAWSEEQPWEESLALTGAAPTMVSNPEDDLERELAFYNQVGEAGLPFKAGKARQVQRAVLRSDRHSWSAARALWQSCWLVSPLWTA